MLKRYEQSQYVYENKQNSDNLPDELSDIHVDSTRILQEITDLEGQIVVNGAFRRRLERVRSGHALNHDSARAREGRTRHLERRKGTHNSRYPACYSVVK